MASQARRLPFGGKRISPLQRREIMWAYIFLGPAFFFLLVLIVFPILFAFWISLHDWSLIPCPFPFIGFQNYVEALQDSLTLKSLKNTLIYTIGVVPVGMTLALLLALVMNQDGLPARILPDCLFYSRHHIVGGRLICLGLDV